MACGSVGVGQDSRLKFEAGHRWKWVDVEWVCVKVRLKKKTKKWPMGNPTGAHTSWVGRRFASELDSSGDQIEHTQWSLAVRENIPELVSGTAATRANQIRSLLHSPPNSN